MSSPRVGSPSTPRSASLARGEPSSPPRSRALVHFDVNGQAGALHQSVQRRASSRSSSPPPSYGPLAAELPAGVLTTKPPQAVHPGLLLPSSRESRVPAVRGHRRRQAPHIAPVRSMHQGST